MSMKKHKAVTSAKATASNFNQLNKSYNKVLPVARKFDYLLGIALLSLLNPTNTKQSQNQLLSVVEDILFLKAELGLYGGTNCD